MKILMAIIISLISIFTCQGRNIDEVPNVHIADRTKYVSNPDGVLSSDAENRLNLILGNIWKETSAEIVVVAVDNLDDIEVNDFATKLFENWGIGKSDKNNGLLILISKEDRKVAFRTGYGMEGVLPDIICGRIIREDMAPYFREGDYDSGTLVAISKIADILGKPEIADEIRSQYANDSSRSPRSVSGDDAEDLWAFLWKMFVVGFGISVILYFITLLKVRKLPPTLQYNRLQKMKIPMLVLTFFGFGFPLIFYWLLGRRMQKVRNKKRYCPNCGEKMTKLDEVSDNAYLTPAQDTEEHLNSVDYDVWLCPQCNEVDIIPFDNPNSPYTVCPRCGSKACQVIEDRTVVHPTITTKGKGVRIYSCKNCGNRYEKFYDIPHRENSPVVIVPGIGRGFGGISGGSFGGGMTGGGGASGGW